MNKVIGALACALIGTVTSVAPAQAQTYKVGMSAGLTGYAATVDRAWRDGVQVAIDYLNAKGGINGRRIELVVEDNRSEPQEAVTVYRKMMSDDKVDIFISGCVSAGNFAAAGMLARAKMPMVLCSVLPSQPDQVKWAFSTIPLARFEVEKRLEYLRDSTAIRKFGVLNDPSPYAGLQAAAAEKEAADYSMQMVSDEQYKQDDADLSVQVGKMNAAGAGAILKIGLGGTTLTAAKNIKQLGLPTLLLTSVEDLAVFRPVAEVLGERFMFVASPSQVYESLPDTPLKKSIAEFLTPWRAKYADRDPNWAGRGWDAVMITAAAIERAKSFDGTKVRDAIEELSGFQGTTGIYDFSATNHYGIGHNPYVLATLSGGKVKILK